MLSICFVSNGRYRTFIWNYIIHPREKDVYAALIRFRTIQVTWRKFIRKEIARQKKKRETSSLTLFNSGAAQRKPTTIRPSTTAHIEIWKDSSTNSSSRSSGFGSCCEHICRRNWNKSTATPHMKPEIIEMQLMRFDIKSPALLQLFGQMKNSPIDTTTGKTSCRKISKCDLSLVW